MEVDVKEKNAPGTPKIQTFVFIDLETTGIWNNPRILELSMVAVSREHLLQMKEGSSRRSYGSNPPRLPRVLHKYTRLFYPRKIIPPVVEEITHLGNEQLCHLSSFNDKAAHSIQSFLDFPSPICFVAHNGYGFDYGILKAELDDVGYKGLLDHIICIDSLLCAKKLDVLADLSEAEEIAKLMDDFSDTEFIGEPPLKRSNTSPSCSNESGILLQNSVIDVPVLTETFSTPEKVKLGDFIQAVPKTPKKLKNGESSANKLPLKNDKAKRTLIFGKFSDPKPYSQPSIYKRLFNASYNAHSAEADSTALLQICSHYSNSFTDWCDNNYKKFSDVKPRWASRRKTFQLS